MASCAWCRSGTEVRVSKGRRKLQCQPKRTNHSSAATSRRRVKRNLAAVDELMVPNYVEHQIPDGRLTSRHSLKQLLAMYYKAFPDMKSVLHDILPKATG